MSKATDLKSTWKVHVETCVTLWYFFKTKKNFHFFTLFRHFFQPYSSTQTIKVIGLIFFYELALKNLAMYMHFNPIAILQGLFLEGRRAPNAPPPAIRELSSKWISISSFKDIPEIRRKHHNSIKTLKYKMFSENLNLKNHHFAPRVMHFTHNGWKKCTTEDLQLLHIFLFESVLKT